jgi:hypothetical protein
MEMSVFAFTEGGRSVNSLSVRESDQLPRECVTEVAAASFFPSSLQVHASGDVEVNSSSLVHAFRHHVGHKLK